MTLIISFIMLGNRRRLKENRKWLTEITSWGPNLQRFGLEVTRILPNRGTEMLWIELTALED